MRLLPVLYISLFFPASGYAEDESAVQESKVDTIVVTATREANRLKNTPASVGVQSEEEIQAVNPSHSAELLNRIAGVNIVQLGSTGEGVMAAIRQPMSTNPVYLYLENGVPTRSPAFFNHNALYEMNIEGGNGIEVIKGPGSALYGSEGIGGVVNLLSGQLSENNATKLTLEQGEYGWKRAQFQAGATWGTDILGLRVSANDNKGWREHSESDRQSLTGSWHTELENGFTANTVFSVSLIDMNTGGSGLLYVDYISGSDQAGNLIGDRHVRSYRLSTAFEKTLAAGSLSITPYLRSNELQYLATWTLNSGRPVFPRPWQCAPVVPGVPCNVGVLDSQDAHVNSDGHDSVGALLKYRQNLQGAEGFWIAGVDFDYSRGFQTQTYIERTDSAPGVYWRSFREAGLLYDYTADFISLSHYFHYERALTEKLHFSGGIRYDRVRFDYHNKLSVVADGAADDPATVIFEDSHYRPEDQLLNLDHVSPKLGLTYQFTPRVNSYAAYRHGFRIPNAGQLFRAGQTSNATGLEAVKADSLEVGIRGNATDRIAFEAAAFAMQMKDAIVSVVDPVTGARLNENTGETHHQGVELGMDFLIASELDVYLAYTVVEHVFDEWQSSSGDYSGKDMPDAPRNFGSMRLSYKSALFKGGRLELEWFHQGAHFIDELNYTDNNPNDRDVYPGHNLVNLRFNYPFGSQAEVFVRVLNAADKLYAETTSKWGPTYTPGRPRTYFTGLSYRF